MKNFFQKLKEFLLRLFFGKKKEEVPAEDITEKEENTEIASGNEVVSVEDNEETNKTVFACFTDEDKDGIIDILRPIIKGFNSDALYVNLCELLEDSKVLKTFASLSEDNMTLTISFTQSKLFNNKIGEWIAEKVEGVFQSTIDAKAFGKYTVIADADRGCVEIKKIG